MTLRCTSPLNDYFNTVSICVPVPNNLRIYEIFMKNIFKKYVSNFDDPDLRSDLLIRPYKLGLKQLLNFCNRLIVSTNRNRNRLTAIYNIVVKMSPQTKVSVGLLGFDQIIA